tara:strand:+ start:1937 stop:3088 length:1152 start_codon:yes stop_codon:yes gene_type:complete
MSLEGSSNNVQEVQQEVDLAPEANESAQTLSFDELDQLTDGRDEKELLSEAKKEIKGEENKSESKEKSSGEKVEAKSEEAEEKIEEIKKLIAKYGDEELEIAANSIFKHKIDGEEVDVELQELLNNYSGKVSYDKKFQEFSSERKYFEEERNEYNQQIENINKYINGFADKLKNKDALGALSYFAEFSGMKPHEFQRELLNQIAPEVERRALMSPEELQSEELLQQNKYLQQQQESVQEQLKQEQAQKELEAEIVSVQEAHGISDEAFNDAYYELVDSEYEGEINPQAVAEYHMHSEAFSRADDILSSINPQLADQDQVVESLQQVIVENPSFDNDDLKEIVEEVYGDMVNKASKTVSKKAAPKETKSITSRKKDNYVSWDDL